MTEKELFKTKTIHSFDENVLKDFVRKALKEVLFEDTKTPVDLYNIQVGDFVEILGPNVYGDSSNFKFKEFVTAVYPQSEVPPFVKLTNIGVPDEKQMYHANFIRKICSKEDVELILTHPGRPMVR